MFYNPIRWHNRTLSGIKHYPETVDICWIKHDKATLGKANSPRFDQNRMKINCTVRRKKCRNPP